MLELFGFVRSRSDRPHWALEEIGVDYHYYRLNFRRGDNRSEPFLAMNPSGKIPVLRDGDLVLTESAAICNYLGRKFPDSGLIPADSARDRAKYDQWMFFILAELEQPLWTRGKHILGRLPEEYRVPDVMRAAHYEWSEALEVFAKGLDGKDYFFPGRVTMIDICAGHTFDWAERFEFPIENPAIQAYRERLYARPAYRRYKEKKHLDFPRPDLAE